MLHQIADRQGFTGHPTVLSREEMDRQVAGGAEEVFHGTRGSYVDERGDVSAADLNEDYRSGPAYYNAGGYGNGVYATSDRTTADGEYSDGSAGSTMRMAIPRGARVGDYGQLETEQAAYLSARDSGSSEYKVYQDLGRYAAARGYDVVRIEGTSQFGHENWYMVLNRSAMLVEEG